MVSKGPRSRTLQANGLLNPPWPLGDRQWLTECMSPSNCACPWATVHCIIGKCHQKRVPICFDPCHCLKTPLEVICRSPSGSHREVLSTSVWENVALPRAPVAHQMLGSTVHARTNVHACLSHPVPGHVEHSPAATGHTLSWEVDPGLRSYWKVRMAL
jgi:hypothetical protein